MAHYDARQLPYYWSLAHNYVLFDRYFSSASGGSLRNHLYWVAGSPGDPGKEAIPAGGYGDLTTIFDRLEAKGVSWKFYVQDYEPTATFRAPGASSAQVTRVPLLAVARFLDDPTLAKHIVPLDEYYKDLGRNTLPAVSYIVPAGSSETPPASVTNGQAFVRSVVAGLKRSTAWSSSALMLSYADWGGWYDHVPPPQVDFGGLGFRVPALLVSPYARKGYIDHTALEHTSILKFIETNWGVAPLSARDAAANNFVEALDFRQRPLVPQLDIESGLPAPVQAGKPGIIYPAYGVAALAGACVIALAVLTGRRRREVLP
jgi:phospholipase C